MIKVKVIENSNNRKAVYFRDVKSKSSKYKGVYLKGWAKRKKWAVKLSLNGRLFHIESFEEEDKAAYCYDLAAKTLIGDKAYTNMEDFPELQKIKLRRDEKQKVTNRVREIEILTEHPELN